MRPPNQVSRPSKKFPSRGGTAYSQDVRRQVLRSFNRGECRDQDWIDGQREDGLFPSDRTIRRWRHQWVERGHIRPFRRTGNDRAAVLRGNDLVLLAVYRTIFPKANTAEINAFIGGMNFGRPDQRFYSSTQIKDAEERLGMSMKVGSTTAYQAFRPINLIRREDYWTRNYPFGMANIHRQDIIDLDEAGIFVETADRKYGK